MYRIIGIIVHAKDEDEALKKAKNSLDYLKEKRGVKFYATLDDEEYWKQREDLKKDLPTAILASNPKGVELIEKGWGATVERFVSALETVNLAIQYLTPEEIMEGELPTHLPDYIWKKFPHPEIGYFFLIVGDIWGKSLDYWLYYQNVPIRTKRDLDQALSPKSGLEAYLVPADVNF